jgi:ATP-dependent RNA helicase DHX36
VYGCIQVAFPNQVQRKVDALLKEYVYRKRQRSLALPENDNFDMDSGGDSVVDEVGGDINAVTRPGMAMAAEELLIRRNRQIRNKQRGWQESEEGKKVLDFRKTLPAYKERDALLAAIARNQVNIRTRSSETFKSIV